MEVPNEVPLSGEGPTERRFADGRDDINAGVAGKVEVAVQDDGVVGKVVARVDVLDEFEEIVGAFDEHFVAVCRSEDGGEGGY